MASLRNAGCHRSVIHATLHQTSIEFMEVHVIGNGPPTWMTLILEILEYESDDTERFSNGEEMQVVMQWLAANCIVMGSKLPC